MTKDDSAAKGACFDSLSYIKPRLTSLNLSCSLQACVPTHEKILLCEYAGPRPLQAYHARRQLVGVRAG